MVSSFNRPLSASFQYPLHPLCNCSEIWFNRIFPEKAHLRALGKVLHLIVMVTDWMPTIMRALSRTVVPHPLPCAIPTPPLKAPFSNPHAMHFRGGWVVLLFMTVMHFDTLMLYLCNYFPAAGTWLPSATGKGCVKEPGEEPRRETGLLLKCFWTFRLWHYRSLLNSNVYLSTLELPCSSWLCTAFLPHLPSKHA